MPTDQTTGTEIDATVDTPSVRTGRRGSRLRWVTAALVVVGVLGFAGASCTPEEVASIAVSNAFEPSQRDCAMRIIERESNYRADAVSPAGSIGLFQIYPSHATWIRNTYGYSFNELIDATKNAEVARGLSDAARSYYGDQWQPWRYGGQVIQGGGCPA